MNEIYAAALEAQCIGLSVLPILSDGTKAAAVKWGTLREKPADQSKISEWFIDGGYTGYAIICGPLASPSDVALEVLDFDDADVYALFRDTAEAIGLASPLDRMRAGYEEKTPKGGRHIPYYCAESAGNTKLARRPGPNPDRPTFEAPVLIETRGDGGYFVAAPSNGRVHPSGRPWELVSGGVGSIATITPDERAALFDLARSFDELPKPESRGVGAAAAAIDDGSRPGDLFTAAHSTVETFTPLIERYGWRYLFTRADGVAHYRRPGKDSGWSATFGHKGACFYPFSSSTELEPETAYSPFAVYAFLEHGGDFRAAARSLVAEGFTGDLEPLAIISATSQGDLPADLQAGPWPELQPLTDRPRPPFPTHELPVVPRQFVEEVADETQTPADIAGLFVLAMYALVLARRYVVRVREGWLEPTCLWTLSVYHSGGGKSPVYRKAAAPIRAIERQLAADMAPLISERKSRRRELEKAIKYLEDALAKPDRSARRNRTSDEDDDAQVIGPQVDMRDDLAAKRAELDELPELHMPALMLDDVTPEALALEMSRNGERAAVVAAEGDAFNNMAGTYSNSEARLAVYLKGHAGDSVHVSRITREPLRLDRPALTMGFSIQPGILEDLGTNRKFKSTGLLARFLKAVPQSEPGYRSMDAPPTSQAAHEAYAGQLERLYAYTVDMTANHDPRELSLSDDARVALMAFGEWIEVEKRQGNSLNNHLDWAGKLQGHTARTAALFHASETAAERIRPEQRPIAESTMRAAIRLARAYWIPHELAAAGDMARDPDYVLAGRIVAMFRRTGLLEATQRDIQTAIDTTIKSDAYTPALAILEERAYIRRKLTAREAGTAGRKPSPLFEVNPAMFAAEFENRGDGSANSAQSAQDGDCAENAEHNSVHSRNANPLITSTPQESDASEFWPVDAA